MNRTIIAACAAALVVAGPAMAQSSKFAATWEEDRVFLASAYEAYYEDPATDISRDSGVGFENIMATIKAPQGKELLVGVSGVANLMTFTEAKGKNQAGTSTSEAAAGIRMFVSYMPLDEAVGRSVCRHGMKAAPGAVPLSMRKQTLSVTTDLDIVDVGTCSTIADDADEDNFLNEGQCLAGLLDIEGSVTVALGLHTAASHHFNFLIPDLGQSTTYAVAACFTGDAVADVLAGEGSARATVAIGKRMVTVQEVRAVKNAFDVN